MRSLSPLATKTSDTRLSAREMTCLATMGALMFALKMAMAALPNIHPVAMLIILTALQFSWRALYAVGVYILLEGVLFGFGSREELESFSPVFLAETPEALGDWLLASKI